MQNKGLDMIEDPDIWPDRVGLRYYKQFNDSQAKQRVPDYAGKKNVCVKWWHSE